MSGSRAWRIVLATPSPGVSNEPSPRPAFTDEWPRSPARNTWLPPRTRARELPGDCLVSAPRDDAPPTLEVVRIAERLARIEAPWTPGIVAELNGQHVKLARLEGEFVWHRHAGEDELFLVIDGRLRIEHRASENGPVESVELAAGELVVVPRGVEHRPVALPKASVLLFEPAGTINTGDAGGPLTVETPRRLD